MAKDINKIVSKLAPALKPRDDAFNQKMNEYHTKRKALLDSDKYLEPEWDSLRDEMQKFRGEYEKPQFYSLREYMLDNHPDEFQIDKVRDDIDFKGLWDLMQKGGDFYHDASVDGKGFDSEVRENLFTGMSDTLGLDYDDVYYKWLGREKPKVTKNPTYNVNPKDAFNKGQISQGQADDVLIARDNKAKDLLKRYYASEFDLGTLHDQLLKLYDGDIKSAFEWLLANARN